MTSIIITEKWVYRIIDNAVKQWRRRLLSCGCERRSFWTFSVKHPTDSVLLYEHMQLLCNLWFWTV